MSLIALSAYYRSFLDANKKGLVLFASTVLYVGYLAVGGLIFLLIEGPQENELRNTILKARNHVMERYPTVPGEAFDELLYELSSAGVKGIILGNATSRWTLGNAVLYASTLLTTIGYGHLSTQSPLGKVVCMTYSAVGIPLTLCILACYVTRLEAISGAFKASLFHRLKAEIRPQAIRAIHIGIIMLFILVGCFLVPAWVFSTLEVNWSFLDSIYFCFISLTTVGLGDYVPGLDSQHPHVDLYRFASAAYLLFGVTVMMFMLGQVSDFVHNYNCSYGDTLASEKILIHSSGAHYYGTIVPPTSKGRGDDEHKTLLP